MCVTCGCGEPHNDHGDPDRLTVEKLQNSEMVKKSAARDNLEPGQAMKNMAEAFSKEGMSNQ